MTTPSSTRRAERRVATVAEIKAAAWADMADSGSVDCSLRAVARRLGMAPSALYRYFSSREDLLTALIVDAFDQLTDTLSAAHAACRTATPPVDPGEAFVQVAAGYRRWAVTNPQRFRLVFGNPVGGYTGTPETTAASLGSTQVLLEIMADVVSAGDLHEDRLSATLSPAAAARYQQWSDALPAPLPPLALAAAITCYAALHGALQLEINGHLPPPLSGHEDVFLATMRQVVGAL